MARFIFSGGTTVSKTVEQIRDELAKSYVNDVIEALDGTPLKHGAVMHDILGSTYLNGFKAALKVMSGRVVTCPACAESYTFDGTNGVINHESQTKIEGLEREIERLNKELESARTKK